MDSPSEVPVVETPSQLVYLSNEKRLAAMELEGKFYHEIDPQTGVDYRKPSIFKSSDEPAKFTVTRLRSPEQYLLIKFIRSGVKTATYGYRSTGIFQGCR